MQRHNEALGHYYQRNWKAAAILFQQLKQANPDDRLYDYYLGQIKLFIKNPPAAGWRGEIQDRRGS